MSVALRKCSSKSTNIPERKSIIYALAGRAHSTQHAARSTQHAAHSTWYDHHTITSLHPYYPIFPSHTAQHHSPQYYDIDHTNKQHNINTRQHTINIIAYPLSNQYCSVEYNINITNLMRRPTRRTIISCTLLLVNKTMAVFGNVCTCPLYERCVCCVVV